MAMGARNGVGVTGDPGAQDLKITAVLGSPYS